MKTTTTYAVEIPHRGYRRVTLPCGSTVDRRHGGGHGRHAYTFRDAEDDTTVSRDAPAKLRRALIDAGYAEDYAGEVEAACLAIQRSLPR